MQFIDEAAISVAAGNGGDGHRRVASREIRPERRPGRRRRRPRRERLSRGTPELSTLVEFRFRRSFAADAGKAGGTSNKSGRSGDDLTIAVPVGTLVYTQREDERRLSQPTSIGRACASLAAKGGRGGLGNQHFATSVRQAPRFAERGEPGETLQLRLELRLLADCGVVGVPNAGKSTCSRSFRPHGRRSPTIPLRRSNRSSASFAFPTKSRS